MLPPSEPVLPDEFVNDPHATRNDIWWAIAIASVAVLLVALVRVLGGHEWFGEDLLAVIGWVGVVVSLAGVILAWLIFRRQTRASVIAEKRQRLLMSSLRLLVVDVRDRVLELSAVEKASAAISDEDAEADGDEGYEDDPDEVGPPEEATAGIGESRYSPRPANDEPLYLNTKTGRKRRLFSPDQIPLSVVAALVSEWKGAGLTGRWTLGTLKGAFRAEGKGNHPWFLVFVPPHDEIPRIWKVTRGPGGSDHAVLVTDVSDL